VSRGDALIGNRPDFTDYVVDQSDTSAYRLLPFRSPVDRTLRVRPTGARGTPNNADARRVDALIAPSKDGDTLDDATLKNFFR